MKPNKKPAIIAFCITALLVIAAILTIFVPKLIKPNAPVQLDGNYIAMRQYSVGVYVLDGTLKNVSDKTVVIKNDGGMKVSFNKTDETFSNRWLVVENGNKETVLDIELEPGESYEFKNCDWYLTGRTTVKKVTVNIDGKSYTIYGNSVPTFVPVLLIFLAVVALCCGIGLNSGAKQNAKRFNDIEALSNQFGCKFTMMTGSISDKDESKKAAAKTAGWVFGAVFTTLLTGRGVYRVYSGSKAADFILSEDRLFLINGQGAVTAENLVSITKNDFPVLDFKVNKNSIVVKCTDNKQVLTLNRMKNCELTIEQLAERVKKILVDGVGAAPVPPVYDQAAPAQTNDNGGWTYNGAAAPAATAGTVREDDPFTEFAPPAKPDKTVENKEGAPADGTTDEVKPDDENQ